MSAVKLLVEPGVTVSRDDFITRAPARSVGLDGYVSGAPFFMMTERGPLRSFNHHEAVDRSCMCATCEQCRRAVLMGFYDVFRASGVRDASVFVNDCDQDVCMASWILLNPDRAAEPLVRTLCQIVDLLDMSAGAFPMPREARMLNQVRWVFEPYNRFRSSGAAQTVSAVTSVISDVHARIDQFVMGRALELEITGSYEIIRSGRGWSLVRPSDQTAREKMISDGIRAAVELVATDGDRRRYSLWRASEYIVSFPLERILCALRASEDAAHGRLLGTNESWGGSATCGGSPRALWSRLSPDDVCDVIDQIVGAR